MVVIELVLIGLFLADVTQAEEEDTASGSLTMTATTGEPSREIKIGSSEIFLDKSSVCDEINLYIDSYVSVGPSCCLPSRTPPHSCVNGTCDVSYFVDYIADIDEARFDIKGLRLTAEGNKEILVGSSDLISVKELIRETYSIDDILADREYSVTVDVPSEISDCVNQVYIIVIYYADIVIGDESNNDGRKSKNNGVIQKVYAWIKPIIKGLRSLDAVTLSVFVLCTLLACCVCYAEIQTGACCRQLMTSAIKIKNERPMKQKVRRKNKAKYGDIVVDDDEDSESRLSSSICINDSETLDL